jgi:hypothetical protein
VSTIKNVEFCNWVIVENIEIVCYIPLRVPVNKKGGQR